MVGGVGGREIAAAVGTLARGRLSRYGGSGTSETERFEAELGRTIGVEHALAVNSGTSALICALVGIGVGPGDEVLVPAYTWVSTAASVVAVGAVPVLVEIDESLTLDPIDLKRKITPRTKAVIPVHMLNLVCDMDPICATASAEGIRVIEDACQAVGVTYRGRRVGSIGDVGAFSFNQHKNIKSGEGGALLTDDDRIFARAGMYHDVGSYTRSNQFATDEPLFVGLNFRMPELCAAILRPQLRRLDRSLAKRTRNREIYLEALAGSRKARVTPHHDPDHASGLSVWFDDPEDAKAFASARGVSRLIDTGRHVYTNWKSVLEGRTYHPAVNPYADGSPRMTAEDCPRTLEVLERTCSVSVSPELPTTAHRLLAKRLAKLA
jgi:dTDP-4-amino-4,6-dideoxygalactose transaminase